MILSTESLEKLRDLINEETVYRSGPKLISFFNQFGFEDTYGQGFPSRWKFTDDRLALLNGTPQLDRCVKNLLSPAKFVGKLNELDEHISSFNGYLTFDKWKVIRKGAEITFSKLDKVELEEPADNTQKTSENEFLQREFSNVSVSAIGLEGVVSDILEQRIREIEKCYTSEAYLSVILVAGSTLEGLMLGLALKHPGHFNKSKASPKDKSGKVRQFHEWTLSAFIDVARDLGLIQHDTHKFSHALRDFRNYIHPFEQMSSGFSPREHTAKICLQVLKAAISEAGESIRRVGA